MAKKGQWGGNRPGAGRPRLRPGRPTRDIVRYTITMPRELGQEIDRFCETAEIGRSAFLEMAAIYFLTNATERAEA
jgi:hypothetical protein